MTHQRGLSRQSRAQLAQEFQQGHLWYRSAAQSSFCNGSSISFLPQLAPDYQCPRAPFQSLFNAPLIIHFSDSRNAARGWGFVTNKYRSNSHLQGTNEGNKNKVEESKIICFVAFNQTLHNGFDYSGEEHAGLPCLPFIPPIPLPSLAQREIKAPGVKTRAGLHCPPPRIKDLGMN